MKKNDLLLLLISSVVLVIMWIIFNIVHSSIISTITDIQSQQISPISPAFDSKTIALLKKRQSVLPDYIAASQSALVTPTPTPIPVFVTPAQSQVTENASQSSTTITSEGTTDTQTSASTQGDATVTLPPEGRTQ